MTNDKQSQFLNRDTLLKLLSDDEIAKVSTAQTASKLAEGDEYLLLEHLHKGVLRAHGTNSKLGNILPRKAVQESTWVKVLKQLAGPSTPAGHHGNKH